MVLIDLHVFQNSQGIRRMHRQRAIKRNQVRGNRVAADPHESHRQARALLTGHTRLIEAHNALTLVANAQQQNLGFAVFDRHLIRWHQRNTSPGQELRTEQADSGRRHATTGALTAESGNRQRMRQEECRFFPDLGQQIVQIVRRRGAR